MRHTLCSPSTRRTLTLLLVLLAVGLLWRPVSAGSARLRVLVVGGGPDPRHNQVAIERHAAYFSRLLPPGTPRYTLFANGDPRAKTVLYAEEPQTLPPGELAFALLFKSREDASPTVQRFRAPQLGRLDGPAKRAAVAGAFAWLKRDDPERVLLYFTGHGSRGRYSDLDNSSYDLWGETLSVRDLAAHLETLPSRTAVTVVMVQCYSGAFGNLIFTGGDPRNGLADREVAGFFATIRDRMAAGCTTEVNEANYQDFSSHFFAALTGRDRVGRTVRGADYNADGRVGMDEAFAYCLMSDASIDVPVCTSDIFLRWALPVANEEVFQTGYTQVHEWATPAQRIALDSLSRALKLTGESRPADAYRMMLESERRRVDPSLGQAGRRFRAAREEGRAAMLERWPDLIDPRATDYPTIRREAVAELARRVADGRLRELLEADEALTQLEEQQYKAELEEARVLRFVRLAKSIVLAHRLRESGDATLRERFERLLKAEAGSLLTRPNS